ncbi:MULTISPECIES: ATP-binding protein [unclassified Bradyrhizobium]|uniref:ATP-binding protein n=1 Tax=unclassified Bradyrhizobium TaxID=2631580 RepID=UPI002098426E|nr:MULTISPECIES: ATP-binding protein [unclassified Bradyrhizobium]
MTSAKLRQAATIENVDYRTARGLDRSLVQNLGTCQWIRDANHLHRRPNRHRQVLTCLCARQQGLPRRLFRPLQAGSPPVRRSRAGAWRRPSGAPDRSP